jgi:bacterioferritin-associated ferredoxin
MARAWRIDEVFIKWNRCEALWVPQRNMRMIECHGRAGSRADQPAAILISIKADLRGSPDIARTRGGIGAMIICSCNVLSDDDVRSVVAAPDAPRSAAQVHRCLGCSPECGRCAPTIRQIVAAAVTRDGATS